MDISIGRLQQLLTVAKTGSFSKAAEELNMSQPALSRSIAAVEDYYGFQIFNRMGRGVQLTSAGKQIINLSGPAVQHLKALDKNFRLFGAGLAGALSVGIAPLLASQALGHLAGDFFMGSQPVSLQSVVRPGDALIQSLINDEIELIAYPESYIEPSDDLDIQTIGALEPVCVCRRGHPLLERKKIFQRDLEGFPWASSVAPAVLNDISLSNQFICDNYHIVKEAVINSDMIAIFTESFVLPELNDGIMCQITILDMPLPSTKIYIAKLKAQKTSPLAEVFITKLIRILDD